MIRNLKILGLALVAVLAMGAMSASAASATDFFTTSNKNPALLTGTSHDHKFSIGATSFQCTTSVFTGTAVHGASEATVLPKYTGVLSATPHETPCTSSLGTVTVHVNDCHYRLTGNTTGSDVGTDATVWIQCPVGKVIQITGAFGCTISVPSQTPTSGGVIYTNATNHTGGAAVTVKATATGITFTTTGPCGLVGLPAHGNNAIYTGTLTATGWEDKNLNTADLTNVEEGARVPVSVS